MTGTWRSMPAPLRALARWVTIVQLVGYTTSLVFVWHTTRLVPPGGAAGYPRARPPGAEGAVPVPQSLPEKLTITPTHLLPLVGSLPLPRLRGALCGLPS